VSLGARTTVLALLLGGRRRPRWRLAVTVYLVALPPLLLAAQLDFIAHAALYSRLFGAAVGIVLLVWALLAGAVWAGEARLRRALRTNLRDGLRSTELVAYLVALVGLGTLAQAGGPGATVALVPVSGALTAAVVLRLRRPAPRRPLAHLAAIGALGAVAAATIVATQGSAPPEDVSERRATARS
jgi:hypothetical protein